MNVTRCRSCERGIRPSTFWSHVAMTDDGCWTWTNGRNRHGYGIQCHTLAHRVAWSMTYGPIPDGLCVRHRCDNPPCVRPDHLELGTQMQNIRDMDERGRRVLPKVQPKKFCPQGHPYEGANVRIAKRGGQQCRACARDREQAKRTAAGRRAVPGARGSRTAPADSARVARAISGERVDLNLAERHLAVRLLREHGLSATETADRLGIAKRTVFTIRRAVSP